MGGSNNSTQMTNQQLAQMRQYLGPYQNALDLPALANIISSGGQGGGVLPFNTAVSMAGDQAATAGLDAQQEAQREANTRIGASVGSGIASGADAAFQDVNARNIAAARNGAAMNQQQLQMNNFQNVYQTLSGVINSLFGGYTSISNAGINNANYNWLTGSGGVLPGFFQGAGAVGGGFASHSDRRLKRNIEKVGKLGPFRVYDYDIDDRRERGVMAQEVETRYPEVISHDDDGYMMVDYKRLMDLVAQNAN
jgi:Chaperone of endosialidase